MKKILVVAMADSVHAARWLEQFEHSDFEFVLFPSSPHRRIHPKIKHLISTSSDMKITIPKGLRRTGLLLASIDKVCGDRVRGYFLRRVINQGDVEILHALETQGAGYISAVALRKVEKSFFFILTLWGSDLFWFQRFEKHHRKLQELLGHVDRLSMECQRDVAIAKNLGYVGEIFPPFPVTGGYQLDTELESTIITKPSSRKIILVKGHTRFVGRGLSALNAVESVKNLLTNYKIVVYSADPAARRKARALSKNSNLKIDVYGRGELRHGDLLNLFKQARIYIGISLSDGISVSLQEAMVFGAFPIQTDTSCADEWIVNGASGFILSSDDPTGIANSLKEALGNDVLVDSASEINMKTARRRLDQSIVSSISENFYLNITSRN